MATDRNENFYEGAAGKLELGKDQPMTTNSVMAIFSTTKTLTGVGLMQLVEEASVAPRLDIWYVHIDHHSRMIDPKSSFQPHLPLETRPSFSRLCHWKRLGLDRPQLSQHHDGVMASTVGKRQLRGQQQPGRCAAGAARLLHPIDHQADGKPGGHRLPTAARTRVAGKESPVSVLWINIWEGNRPGDKVERLRLYRRDIE